MKSLRILLALFTCAFLPLQAAEAPASLDNVSNITFTIQNGTGVFGTYGRFVVYSDTRNNTYQLFGLSGDTANSSGTFTYSKTSTNGARLSVNDSLTGVGMIQNLVFSTPDSGTYSHFNNLGLQIGTFKIQYSTTTDLNSEAINELNNQIELLTDLLAQKDAQLAQMSAERDARPTTEELQEARAGSVVLTSSENGTVTLKMMIEESSDLSVWQQNGDSVEMELPLAEGKKFLRFAME